MIDLWWRVQRGVPTPVGISILGWTPSAAELHEAADEQQGFEEGELPRPLPALPRSDSEVEFPRITRTMMRELPVTELFESAREALVELLTLDVPENVDFSAVPGGEALLERLRQQVEPERASLAKPRGGRDLGDDHYREVAQVYKAAVAAGDSPTKAVADHFTVSKSSAAKKVARARERDFLPPTSRGRVGPLTKEL